MHGVRDEQLLEQVLGEAVGHAGHVVGHGAQIVALGDGAVLLGHLLRVRHVVVEQGANEARGLVHLRHHDGRRVHAREQERPKLHHGVPHRVAHADVVCGGRRLHHVHDERLDARGVVGAEHRVRRVGQVALGQDARAYGVVYVVVHVGDAVGRAHDAALERLGSQVAGVVEDAVAHLGREVEPLAAVLDALHHAQALLVMPVERLGLGRSGVDAPVAGDAARERLLAGVAERRVPQIVPERDGLGQVLVQPERPRDGARDLRHLERVGEPGAEVVALGGQEHLRLVRQASERLRVEDLVAVALVVVAQDVGLGRAGAALALVGERGVGRERLVRALLLVFAMDDAHGGPPCSS